MFTLSAHHSLLALQDVMIVVQAVDLAEAHDAQRLELDKLDKIVKLQGNSRNCYATTEYPFT